MESKNLKKIEIILSQYPNILQPSIVKELKEMFGRRVRKKMTLDRSVLNKKSYNDLAGDFDLFSKKMYRKKAIRHCFSSLF